MYKRQALYGLSIDWFALNDPGWRFLTYIISIFCINEVGFFFIVAIFYVFSNRYFCIQQTKYSNYLFVAVVAFLGFYSYGVNTIRAGVALSVLLIAMANLDRSKILFICISVLAICIHKSVVIPVCAIIIACYFDKPRYYVYIWLLCLVVSFVTDGKIKEYIVSFLGEEDMRISSYIGASEHAYYRVGFRWDFIAYSVFPIIIGLLQIEQSKLTDKVYRRLFNAYVIANAFWLLVISVPFSDRFVYLSWFLYPYVLLLPYVGKGNIKPDIKKATLLTIVIGGFNVVMNLL